MGRIWERERGGGKIERGQDMGGEQDLRRGLRVRYVRASDVRRGSDEKREKERTKGAMALTLMHLLPSTLSGDGPNAKQGGVVTKAVAAATIVPLLNKQSDVRRARRCPCD